MKTYNFDDFSFQIDSGVFMPTKTSEILIKSVLADKYYSGSDLLDLGCGSGIVGITLSKSLKLDTLYASDLKQETIDNTRLNCQKYSVKSVLKYGNLLDPWKNFVFSNIVCDVSGVAESFADVSEWFGDFAPCFAGHDGTLLALEIIKKAPLHLKPNGSFYMAVLTLSNYKKIFEAIENQFGSFDIIGEEEYYLPKQFSEQYSDLISTLNSNGSIFTEFKFGFHTWKTYIIKASI